MVTGWARAGEHLRLHGASYVGIVAVVGTVLAGQLQASSMLETGRQQVAGTLEATRVFRLDQAG